MKKLIIAGSRKFKDFSFLEEVINKEFPEKFELICGYAFGADKLGLKYSKKMGYPEELFKPNWYDFTPPVKIKYNNKGTAYNALAGFKRNKEMAKVATDCIVFWDGVSKGSWNMIEQAINYNLNLIIVTYENS